MAILWPRKPLTRTSACFSTSCRATSGSSPPEKLIAALPSQKILWFMPPAGDLLDEMLFKQGLVEKLSKGDIVIDGGNSFYRDSQRRAKELAKKGVHFFESGTSG